MHRAAPVAPLFIYDGDCRFCRRWAGWLQRRVHGTVAFAPFQALEEIERFDLTIGDVRVASYLVEQGRAFGGGRGVARALRHAAGAWKVLGVVLDLPGARGLTAIAYRCVARNRHRLPAPDREITPESR